MIIKQSLKKHLTALRRVLVYMCMALLALIILLFVVDIAFNEIPWEVVLIPSIIPVIPVLGIHIQYVLNEKSKHLEINNESLKIYSGRNFTEIKLQDIDVNKSSIQGNNTIINSYAPWTTYYYTTIIDSKGEVWVLSCLLITKKELDKVGIHLPHIHKPFPLLDV